MAETRQVIPVNLLIAELMRLMMIVSAVQWITNTTDKTHMPDREDTMNAKALLLIAAIPEKRTLKKICLQ